jgi:hypothetical protein
MDHRGHLTTRGSSLTYSTQYRPRFTNSEDIAGASSPVRPSAVRNLGSYADYADYDEDEEPGKSSDEAMDRPWFAASEQSLVPSPDYSSNADESTACFQDSPGASSVIHEEDQSDQDSGDWNLLSHTDSEASSFGPGPNPLIIAIITPTETQKQGSLHGKFPFWQDIWAPARFVRDIKKLFKEIMFYTKLLTSYAQTQHIQQPVDSIQWLQNLVTAVSAHLARPADTLSSLIVAGRSLSAKAILDALQQKADQTILQRGLTHLDNAANARKFQSSVSESIYQPLYEIYQLLGLVLLRSMTSKATLSMQDFTDRDMVRLAVIYGKMNWWVESDAQCRGKLITFEDSLCNAIIWDVQREAFFSGKAGSDLHRDACKDALERKWGRFLTQRSMRDSIMFAEGDYAFAKVRNVLGGCYEEVSETEAADRRKRVLDGNASTNATAMKKTKVADKAR